MDLPQGRHQQGPTLAADSAARQRQNTNGVATTDPGLADRGHGAMQTFTAPKKPYAIANGTAP